jgi:hypothetical protein
LQPQTSLVANHTLFVVALAIKTARRNQFLSTTLQHYGLFKLATYAARPHAAVYSSVRELPNDGTRLTDKPVPYFLTRDVAVKFIDTTRAGFEDGAGMQQEINAKRVTDKRTALHTGP